MYAVCADQSEAVLGVFQERKPRQLLDRYHGQRIGSEGQMTYGNCIVVHPEDPNLVLCGGVDLSRQGRRASPGSSR